MSKFSHVKELAADKEAVREYEIVGIASMPNAVLIGRPASRRANPLYQNAVLKVSTTLQRKMQSAGDKVAVLNSGKDATRKPFADFVLVGWRGIIDSDGKEVKFTPEDALDFVKALPDYLFDEITFFFETESNFAAEAVANAKN